MVSLDHSGRPTGIIPLYGGSSVYAGGKFGVILEYYVIPETRSTGIGKALLEKAKKVGRTRGWKRIEVTPPNEKESSQTYRVYMGQGFGQIGPGLKLEDLEAA